MLTKNFERLQSEVTAHVKADRVAQGSYSTCFIGCLANGHDNPAFIESKYGVPILLVRLAESIFEDLPADEAPLFFAAFPEAIGSDGKDLTLVGWKFLATELRALPPVPADIQAYIGSVIEGMDLLAEGKKWPETAARAAFAFAAWSDAAWSDAAYYSADATARAAHAAYSAPRAAAYSAACATYATARAAFAFAAWSDAAWSDGYAAGVAAARLRQRDTLLQLIKEAPTTQEKN